VTRRRLRIWAMAGLVLAVILFVSTVQVLQWLALVLVLASILILTWTLFTTERGDVR
jgi:multidrug transporter EmrE-like cation transporter